LLSCQGFYITNGERYIRDSLGHEVTTDKNKAFIWKTRESAERVLNNSLSALFKKQGNYYVEEEIHSVTPLDADTKDIINTVLQFLEEYDTIQAALEDAPQRLSIVDKKLTDILHYIEMTDQNAANGYKLYKKVKELRIERRNIKRLIYLKGAFNTLKLEKESINSIKNTINGFEHEKYTARILNIDDILNM
jgi:hypothetical protein